VSGNFFFEGGSDGSSVLGLYLSGTVNISTNDASVKNFLLRFCNVNGVHVGNSNCQNITINQNYVRGCIVGGSSAISLTNNIINVIINIRGGTINHNIYNYISHMQICAGEVDDSQITNNIILGDNNRANDCIISNNMSRGGYNSGNNVIAVTDWAEEFSGGGNVTISPNFDFRLKDTSSGKNAGTDGTDIGIYGGTGFSNSALPPGPRIVSKKVSEQTDANGNLRVEIKVSAQ
jgi:hypothetical protein